MTTVTPRAVPYEVYVARTYRGECGLHGVTVTNGMFDAPCGGCEAAMEANEPRPRIDLGKVAVTVRTNDDGTVTASLDGAFRMVPKGRCENPPPMFGLFENCLEVPFDAVTAPTREEALELLADGLRGFSYTGRLAVNEP